MSCRDDETAVGSSARRPSRPLAGGTPLRPVKLRGMLSKTPPGRGFRARREPTGARKNDMTVRRVLRSLWLVGVLAVHAASPTGGSAQVPAETEARLRSIFEARDFDARSFQAAWLPDGAGYATLEAPSGTSVRELIRYDAASGYRTVLASLSDLTPSGASEPLSISGYQFPPDGSWVLLGTDGDGFWMFDVATSTLKQVDGGRREHDLPGRRPHPLHPRRRPSRPRPRRPTRRPG